MSIQKARESFNKRNPDFTYHSVSDYHYWKKNDIDPNVEAAIRPTRLNHENININWYDGADFIDDSWNKSYNGLVYVSFYNFEKLAFYFGHGTGKLINPNNKTLIVITDDDEYLWQNGQSQDIATILESKLPNCVELSGNLKANNYSWPLYLNKKIRTL